MKKRIILLVLLLISVTISASGNKESWFSIGGELSRATEDSTAFGTDYKTTLNSVGLFLGSYEFAPDEDTGFFSHGSFLIPTGGNISSMGSSVDYTYSDIDFRSHLSTVFGPAYKTSISNTTNLYFGFGPSFHQLSISEYPISMISYMFGLGVDAGLHISTADNRFMNLGVLVDYNFANYTNLNNSGEWATEYSLTSIRPYFGIGFVR